jgi:biotin-[acetyl-CoA-carboxylase] ligase BirA-like protein
MLPHPKFQLFQHVELDSTNEEARRQLQAGALNQLSIIRAASQTAGRGTQGRQWISPAGAGLYFSIVHPFWALAEMPPEDIPLTPIFTLAAGVACAETIRELTGLQIQLKPINDLYVENRKLGGILVESLITQNQCKALITGIGINVLEHQSVAEGCKQDERGNQPISLQSAIAPHIFSQWHGDAIMQELCEAISQQVHHLYLELIAGNAEAILNRYQTFKLPGYELQF